jgi:hypothetical protein
VSSAAVVAFLGLLLVSAEPAAAQLIETRKGEANPVVSVFKSTIYGSLAGLVLGGAVELIDDDDDDTDALKWGFVGGAFFGFGYGLYHVMTRPEPQALLERGPQGWELGMPQPTVAVVSRRPLLLAPGECRLTSHSATEVRTTLFAYSF